MRFLVLIKTFQNLRGAGYPYPGFGPGLRRPGPGKGSDSFPAALVAPTLGLACSLSPVSLGYGGQRPPTHPSASQPDVERQANG